MLNTIFEKLHLEEKHAKVYVSLIVDGATMAGKLAKKLGIPRSTLYGLLYDLHTHGLVTQSKKEGVKIWSAEPPEKIAYKVNERISGLEEVSRALPAMISELRGKQKQDFISPKFSYYEGVDSLKQMLKDVLLYRDIETVAFWPIKEMIKILGRDFFIHSNKRRIKQNIHARVIWPVGRRVRLEEYPFLGVGEKFKRDIRLAPKDVDCSMGYWAYENKVAFLSSKAESFGFIVESIELKQLLQTQFEVLWNLSTPITPKPESTDRFLRDAGIWAEDAPN